MGVLSSQFGSWVRRCVPWAVLLACGTAAAQPTKPAGGVRASAMKMPDGTIVFLTKTPGDADPKIDGVLLSAAEYQALVEQAGKVKKAQDGAKPQPPGKVELRARVEQRGDRTVAAVTAVFTCRTVTPKAVVALGCQRATATGAKGSDGKTPVLTAGEDGLAVLVETPGDHTLTLDLEAVVSARGPKGELGFEFGLPRAAITTVALDQPPADVPAVSVGTRSPEPFAAVKYTPAAVATLTAAYPLGPTDTLELLWEPRAAADAAELTADGDVVIRVDDTQVETVAKLNLRGPAKEWPLTVPPNAELTVERVGKAAAPLTSPAAAVKPADPQKPTWVIRTPPDADGWLVTVTARTPRPAAADPAARGPYPIGPFHLPAVRHTGRVRVYASPTVRVGFRPAADLRRQDLPTPADDDLVAVFQYAAPAVERGWGVFDVRPVSNAPRVRPHHKLTLTQTGWRLESTVRVTPPPRGEVEQMTVELPAGWQGWEFGPDDQVESDAETAVAAGRRAITLRFITPQKAAADLRVTATYPLPATDRQAALPFPRFLQADERDSLVEVVGGDGWAVSAAGHGWDRGTAGGVELRAGGRGVTGEFDRGAGTVEVSWRPFRPELACDVRADVTVQDRQLTVQQAFRFRLADGDTRPLRLTAPGELVGLRWTPRLDPVGASEWVYRLPADAGKEVTLVAQYAVKVPPRADDSDPAAVPLIHPAAATSTDTVVRVWGGGGRRAAGFVGDWRELAPEPAPDADTLPWFTLGSSAPAPPPLALAGWTAAAPVVVERAVVQATVGEAGGSRIRGRYLLRRWEGGHVDFDLPPFAAVEATVDGKRADPVPLPGGARVVVPEMKPGRVLSVDVRVLLPAANARFGSRVLTPPAPRQASYRGPVRWQVFGGPADVLAPAGGGSAEWRWGWRGYGFGPVPVESAADVENWFHSAAGSDAGEPPRPAADADTLLVRQPTPGPLRVVTAPRPVAVLVASAFAFAVVYGLVRLAGRWTGPAVVVLAAVAAVAVVGLPYPTAAVAAAGQPGAALAVAALAARTAWGRYHRRSTRPATFSTTPPAAPGTPSGNGAPRPNGATGSSPSDAVRVIGS